MRSKKPNRNLALRSLQLGLAFVFAYAAISSLLHPNVWAGFLPTILTTHISAHLLVKVFAVYELGLTIWLLTGKKLEYAALLIAATLIGIVFTNLSQLITTFRDIGLIFMAISLYFIAKE